MKEFKQFLRDLACMFGFHKWELTYHQKQRQRAKYTCDNCGAEHWEYLS